MRRLPLLVSGMLLLPLGLFPAVSAAGATLDPTPTPSVTAEPEEPELPEVPEEPEEPEIPDVLSGTFTRTPASGPAGTTVTVTSEDECVDEEGNVGPAVDVVMFNLGPDFEIDSFSALRTAAAAEEAEGDEEFDIVNKVVETDEDGGWTADLKVFASAQPGDYVVLIAGCFAEGVDPAVDEPFLIYEPQEFTVTGAPTAPPAEPVPGDPSFTG